MNVDALLAYNGTGASPYARPVFARALEVRAADSAERITAETLLEYPAMPGGGKKVSSENAARVAAKLDSYEPASGPASEEEGGGIGFGDVLDVINPLHHLPVLGSVYRNVSGNEIGVPARFAGGALFGGVIGAGTSLINILFEAQTGRDVTGAAAQTAAANAFLLPDRPQDDLPATLLAFTS